MLRHLIKGLVTCVPGAYKAFSRATTGGTCSASYCYSVWLRHLVKAHESGLSTNPATVAELGPGDSIGIGLAALVTGARQYHALDIVRFANDESNLTILDDIVALVRRRADIPGDTEWPEVIPRLESYAFPQHILDCQRLDAALAQPRLEAIRASIRRTQTNPLVQYHVPWNDRAVVRPNSVDMIFTQAVLEHVDDLAWTYECLRSWLRPEGFMSNTVDFRCHGTAREWDGHWSYPSLVWKMIRGRRPYLINRQPFSTHERLLRDAGFHLHYFERVRSASTLSRSCLPDPVSMSDDDLTTSCAFMQATPFVAPLHSSRCGSEKDTVGELTT
ncbi:MAG: hypothetical protein GF331_11345 [Chitinivibrionales bacterium]|nr:hypothetical protein [Chitinivibrionales bacterium]